MQSENFVMRRKAMDLLLAGEPAKAKADTRKLIVRLFGAMVESEHGEDQNKAVRGLALWGGKDGVPTLLKLLGNEHSFLRKTVLEALGPLQDERAAVPVANLLGDFFVKNEARECLRQMGAAAEEGLLKVLYSDDADVVFTALDLLGDAGSAKCLPTLREGLRSRNVKIREATKNAIRKIVQRDQERKAAEKKEKEESGSEKDDK
jgi:HEAT repeat protein